MMYIVSPFSNSFKLLVVCFNMICFVQIYTRPFTMMPVSAVERPGNL